MRQRARHEQVIGIASSGIEYKMTREREPTPSHHRHPRRFTKLTAHTTLPPRPAGRGAERRNGKRGEPPIDKASGTKNHDIASPARKRGTDRRGRWRNDSDGAAKQHAPPRRANPPGIANERGRESGTTRKQADRPQPRPQPQILKKLGYDI